MKLLIAIVTIMGLAAVGGAIFMGMTSFDGLVTEHPYEKGLRWDEINRKKEEAGWSIEINPQRFTAGDNQVEISVRDRTGKALEDAVITVITGRPATDEYDAPSDTIKLREGLYRADLHLPLYGYWDMRIDVSKGGETLQFRKRVFVKRENNPEREGKNEE